MLDNFDLSLLNDSEFKEDSVREEIIAPLLRKLGYSASGKNKIVRSRPLIHPFVRIGSKNQKVNIIPDYILEIDGKPIVVLDAKSPSVNLYKTENSEQAYSYAIHPEVRAKVYGLCNGREWVFWDVDKFEPILQVTTEELISDIGKIEKILKPQNLIFPEMRNFHPDFGLRFKKLNMGEGVIQHFICNQINSIMKVEDELYCTTLTIDFGDELLAISYDFDQQNFEKFLNCCPVTTQTLIKSMLSRQPFIAKDFPYVYVSIKGILGELTVGIYEEFIPIIVLDVLPSDIEVYEDLKKWDVEENI